MMMMMSVSHRLLVVQLYYVLHFFKIFLFYFIYFIFLSSYVIDDRPSSEPSRQSSKPSSTQSVIAQRLLLQENSGGRHGTGAAIQHTTLFSYTSKLRPSISVSNCRFIFSNKFRYRDEWNRFKTLAAIHKSINKNKTVEKTQTQQ